MRMIKRQVEEPGKPFKRDVAQKHHGHIGPGPKPRLKRAVNVSVDAEILALAKEMDINLSQTLEDALRTLTEDERVRRWQEEHRDFFESYNAYVERNGTLAEALWELDDPSV
jgi:antitoxin CcdA